jgi:hypothetical protein
MAVSELQGKLDDVKTIMAENIQFALRNTEKVEDIQVKSERLVDSSDEFKGRAAALKRRYCTDSAQRNLFIGCCILASIGLLCLGLLN